MVSVVAVAFGGKSPQIEIKWEGRNETWLVFGGQDLSLDLKLPFKHLSLDSHSPTVRTKSLFLKENCLFLQKLTNDSDVHGLASADVVILKQWLPGRWEISFHDVNVGTGSVVLLSLHDLTRSLSVKSKRHFFVSPCAVYCHHLPGSCNSLLLHHLKRF